MKVLMSIIAVTILLIGFLACERVSQIVQPTELGIKNGNNKFTIGVIFPLTGHISSTGQLVKAGIDLALSEINEAEQNNLTFKFIIQNDNSTSEGAVAAINRLVCEDQVSVILGSSTSSATQASFPIMEVSDLTWADDAPMFTAKVDNTNASNVPMPPKGMVLVPAGEFQMGSNDPKDRKDAQPVHTVYVDAFYMDQTEVTNTQYKAFLLENPQWQKGRVNAEFVNANYLKHWNGNNYPSGRGNHPVVYVSWYAVMAYAEWAGKRLPTEAEWEYAARGGLAGKKYPHGDTITAQDANYGGNVGDTTPMRKYPGNGYKLYDMTGNVSEWCLDMYKADFYSTFLQNGVARNPLSGAKSVNKLMDNFTEVNRLEPRVLRGGTWLNSAYFVRVSCRDGVLPWFTSYSYGFRCVKDK